jgi:arsenical pump membrane protein
VTLYDVAVSRAVPVLGFLIAVTLLAELSERAGVFAAAARGCARLARGSTPALYALVAILGSVVTIGLSLDSTAVLLTPVVLTLATSLGLSPRPFAFLAIWLANTASLLLPVSNLTNLLALNQLRASGIRNSTDFAARMWLPELAAIAVSAGWIALLHRREIRGRYTVPDREAAADRVLFTGCTLACLALGPGVLLGAPPWAVATGGAAICSSLFLWRKPNALSLRLVPWRLVVGTELLFVVVTLLGRHGLDTLLRHAVGNDGSLRAAGVAAAASNGFNNLPAYLALERVVPAGHPDQLLGVLLGTNGGPLVLVWGSLATLLWRRSCAQRGMSISAVRFGVVGLGGVPILLVATWAALQVTG